MEGATEQAVNAVMCATATPTSWPDAFIAGVLISAAAFIIYCMTKK